MRLAELQNAFQAHVLLGDRQIEALVPGTERFDTTTRLEIYDNAYVARLNEALAETFPALRFALGESKFDALTRAFALKMPPSRFSIRYYGSELARFIATEQAGTKARVLSELALWEWTLSEAFDAADAVALTSTDLERIEPAQWPQIRFQLLPSVRRICLRTNAVRWWQAASASARRPSRWHSQRATEWVVWRPQLTTHFRSLPSDEAWALDVVARGETFASVCEGLVKFHRVTAAPTQAATLLRSWLQGGLIAGVELPAHEQ